MASAPEPQVTHADVLLQETQAMLAPLARMLVAHGVTYTQLVKALKPVFLAAAQSELAQSGKESTDSALSLLSGVHRKDVRSLVRGPASRKPADRTLSFAAQVSIRWSTDRKYLDARGRPKVLPLRASRARERSFETLTHSISRDFHPHSVLNELVRLGLAEVRAERVHLLWHEFTPRDSLKEVAYLAGLNAHDHLAAVAANLGKVGTGEDTPYLEYSIYADDITTESAAKLEKLARKLWSGASKQWLKKALVAFESDKTKPASLRTARARFGAYTFAEPEPSVKAAVRRSPGRGSK
jgi:hypothetical protein